MAKDKIKFYAVAAGRKPGVYTDWFGPDGAHAQIDGFPSAVFQKFSSTNEALAWLKQMRGETSPATAAPSMTSAVTQQTLVKIEISLPQQQPKVAVQQPEIYPENLPPEILTKKKKSPAKDTVIIYTDGGCSNNPGPGGYGAVLKYGAKRKEISGGFRRTTNNRMELTACIEALKALKYPCSVKLHSDSQYVVKGITHGWAKRWRKKKWMRNQTERAENADLWNQLLTLCETHKVDFVWVRGHAGNKENERCDTLATKASSDTKHHAIDTAYETGQTTMGDPILE